MSTAPYSYPLVLALIRVSLFYVKVGTYGFRWGGGTGYLPGQGIALVWGSPTALQLFHVFAVTKSYL